MSLSLLRHFSTASRTEPIRVACGISGISIEDLRMPCSKSMAHKHLSHHDCPMVEDNELRQSNALLRYVGKRTKLYPQDDWEAAHVDAVLDAVEDITAVINRSQETRQASLRKELVEKTLPSFFSSLDKYLAELSGTYACGRSMSIADLKLYSLVDLIKSGKLGALQIPAISDTLGGIPTDITDSYDRITLVCELVENDARVKNYYATISSKE